MKIEILRKLKTHYLRIPAHISKYLEVKEDDYADLEIDGDNRRLIYKIISPEPNEKTTKEGKEK